MPEIAVNLVIVVLAQVVVVFCQNGHYWPNGYNRFSRSHTWSNSPMKSGRSFQSQQASNRYSNPSSFQSQAGLKTYSSSPSRFSPAAPQSPPQFPRQQTQPMTFPASPFSQPSQVLPKSRSRFSTAAQQSPPQFPRQQAQPKTSQMLAKSRSFSSPRNSVSKRLSVQGDRFPSYADRCGNCKGEPGSKVCGSDGKTYKNSCELKYISCKKYWDLREVSKGACSSDCPGVSLGMYTGWGLSRASNNGYCHHDFFRCCKAARKTGLPNSQIKSCCQARADKCFAFVAEKPWRSGIVKYGK